MAIPLLHHKKKDHQPKENFFDEVQKQLGKKQIKRKKQVVELKQEHNLTLDLHQLDCKGSSSPVGVLQDRLYIFYLFFIQSYIHT